MIKYSTIFVLMCLFTISQAQTTYTVTNTNDSGAGSLRQAILDAEASTGADIIDMTGITGTITLSSGLPNISEDLTINGAGSASTIIDGNSQVRPFFIGGAGVNDTDAPVVVISAITVQNGYAEGVSPSGTAGGGAGMGGAIFINDGDVTIFDVTLTNNTVQGGEGGDDHFSGGGDGGDGPFAGTGGDESRVDNGQQGGTGGYGAGGGGGNYNFNFGGGNGGSGGFGGGGGGGGGHPSAYGSGGPAGSFGGAGATANSLGSASGGGGAGLGGAIFLRNGVLAVINTTMSSNTATRGIGGSNSPEPAGGNGQGKGGAIFNHSGFVSLDNVTFSGNTATSAGTSITDNVDNYGQVLINDNQAPSLTFSPVDQSTDQAISTIITISSDKSLYTGGNEVTDSDLAGLISFNEGTQSGTAVPFSATISNNVITITPDNDLVLQATFFVTVYSVDDYFQNSTSTQTISFSTSDNNAPTFTVADITVDEDDPATTINGWASAFDDGDTEVTQNLTLDIISNDSPELFDGDITFTQAGDITFTPAADYFGVATLEATLTDDGPGSASSTETFTITITAVDDSPTIAPDDIVLDEDAGTINLSNWINFDPGFNETDDLEEIYVEVLTGEELFSSFTEGNLSDLVFDEISFTLVDNAFGTATFLVRAYEPDFDRDEAVVTITINPIDDDPEFSSTPITSIDEGATYRYFYEATDVDDAPVTYDFQLPDWLSIVNEQVSLGQFSDFTSNSLTTAQNGSILAVDRVTGVLYQVDTDGNKTSLKSGLSETYQGITTDNNGNIYLTSLSSKVYKIDAQGVLTTIAGNGTAAFSGDGGLATSAEVNRPSHIGVNSSGEIYFIDQVSQAIRKIATDGTISTVIGLGNGGVTNPYFSGLAVHPTTDEIYFTYRSGVGINKLNGSTVVAVSSASSSSSTPLPFEVEGANISTLRIRECSNIVFNSDGSYYFSAADGNDWGVFKVDTDGTTTYVVGADADVTPSIIASFRPDKMGVDGNDDIYIIDSNDGRKIKNLKDRDIIKGTPTDAEAGDHSVNISATGGLVTVDQSFTISVNDLNSPPTADVATDITINEDAGTVSQVVLTNLDDGDALVEQTFSISVTNVQDASLFAVQPTFDVNTGEISFETAEDAYGSSTVDFTLSDDGTGTNSTDYALTITINAVNDAPKFINTPAATANEGEFYLFDPEAFDPEGDAFTTTDVTIPDWFEDVQILGKVNTYVSGASFPTELAIAADGTVYSTGNKKIEKVNANGTTTLIYDGGSEVIFDLVIDDAGDLYFSSQNDNVIRKIDVDNAYSVSSFAGIPGQRGSSLAEGPATTTEIGYPQEMVFDAQGNLIYYDAWFSRLMQVTTTGQIEEIAFFGRHYELDENDRIWAASNSFTKTLVYRDENRNAIGSRTLALVGTIEGIDPINEDEIYIVDRSHRVYLYSWTDDELELISGGDAAYAGDGGSLEEGRYANLRDVQRIASGEILLADQGNQRIRILENVDAYGGTPTETAFGTNLFSIKAEDENGAENVLDINITVSPFEYAPTDIEYLNTNFSENEPAGTIATLSGVDLNISDTHTFQLVAGDGDDDNGFFTISGNELISSGSFNYEEKDTYNIRVQVTDSEGEVAEIASTIEVVDVIDPLQVRIFGERAYEDRLSIFPFEAISEDGLTIQNNLNIPSWASLLDRTSVVSSTFVGGTFGDQDGTGTDARVGSTSNGAFASNGDMYFVGETYHKVKRVTPAGVVTTFAGDGSNASADGPLLSASFQTPKAIAIDPATDVIYVGETFYIKKIEGGNVSTLAGNGSSGSVDGTGAGATLSGVRDMIFADGVIYFITGTELRKVTTDGVVTTIAWVGHWCYALTMADDGHIYVANSPNGGQLVKVNPKTGETSTFSSGYFPGISLQNFGLEFHLGAFYLVNFFNHELVRINTDGSFESLLFGQAGAVFHPEIPFSFPRGMKKGPDNALYIFANGSIQKYNPKGLFIQGTPTASDLGEHTIEITASATGVPDVTESITIEVLNTNDAPTGIALDNLSVDEKRLAGELVGTLSTTDEDPGDSFTYALVSGTGDTDNQRFSIVDDQLFTAEIFNFNSQTYSVRIETEDVEGATFEESFTITVNQVADAPPQLSNAPILTATEGDVYNYAFGVQDLDTPPVFISQGQTFELVTATGTSVPDWLTLNTTPGGLNELIEFSLPFKIDASTNTYYGVTGVNVITAVPGVSFGQLLATDDLTAATDLAINPNGDVYVVDGQHIKTISGGILSTLHTFTGTMQRIEFHPDGFLVYIVEEGFEFDLKKLTLAGVESTLATDINFAYGFDVSPNGTIAYSGYSGNNDYVIEQRDATGASLTPLQLNLEPWDQFTTNEVSLYLINELAYNANGELYLQIIAAEQDGTLYDMIIDPSESELWSSTDSYVVGRLEFSGTALNFQAPNGNQFGSSIYAFEGPRYTLTGTPEREDVGTNSVTLTLTDQNSTVPVNFDIEVDFVNGAPTDINISGTSIDENNPLETDLLTFSTVDPDDNLDTFTYDLVAGTGDTDNSNFEIVGEALRALQVFDAESDSDAKSIRVRATDAAGESVEVSFEITINDVNEAPTAIALSGDMEVEENLDAGTVIGSLITTDVDAGDTHTYSISGVGSDLFQVVGNELRTAASLDFEQAATYTLTVTTEDAGSLTFDEDFTITIINDTPTDILLSNSSVDEGLLPGVVVGTLSTEDTDPNNTFTYSFVTGQNLNAFFNIDGDELKTVGIFDAALFSAATIRVKTTDAIGESFEKDLTITINDLDNSAPQLIGAPSGTGTQGELYAYGPGIYDFDGDEVTVTSTLPSWLTQFDQDASVSELLAENGAQNLEVDDDDNVYITIQDGNGAATNIMKYDDDTETTSLLLTTEATSITFVDVDENGVVYFSDNNFSGSSYRLRKIDGSTVSNVYEATGEILAGGYHTDEYLVLVETQTDNTRDIIRIDLDGTDKEVLVEEVGYVGVFEVGDDDNIHYSTSNIMEAVDIDGDPATSLQPALTTSSANGRYLYYISDFVMYNRGEAFIMYADNDNGASLDYLVKVTAGGEQELWRGDVIYEGGKIAANAKSEVFFTRDSDSDGRRSVARWDQAFSFFFGTPEDEDVGVSNLDFTLSDGELSNSYSFEIDIANINDAPTAISLSESVIEENNDVNSVVATISSDDPDNDEGDTQTYELIAGEGDDDNDSFEIDGTVLKVLAAFDHEASDTRSIRIKATDESGDTYEEVFEIAISDLNESPTAIELSAATIDENEPSGTTIGVLSTVDPDETNDNLVFEVITGSEYVQVSGSELQSSATFDFETASSFTITLRAQDGVAGTAEYFTIEEDFTITVIDVSESPSDIALDNATVIENADQGTTVGTLSAQDPDGSGASDFSLVNNAEDNDLFDISGDELITASVFDFETQSTYSVEVQVSDGAGNTFTEVFQVTISDENEAPIFSSESSFDIEENSTEIALVSATDEDINTELTFTISGGSDGNLFDLTDQELTFSDSPNFELPLDEDEDNVYEIILLVSDGINEVEQNVTITVTDVNEVPTFSSDVDLSLVENGVGPLSVEASDPDRGTTLTYTLTGGADQDFFSLSGSEVSFVASPDFENPEDEDGDNTYEFTVQVTDGTNQTDADFTVTITNVNEAPIFGTVTEYDLEENSTNPITISASDVDEGSTLTYTITSGSDQGLFSLSGNALSFVNVPDFEVPSDSDEDNVYELTIQVSDGTNEVSADFTITVTDVNEAPSLVTTSLTISENSTGPLSVEATDPDNGTTLTYTLIGGLDQDLFSLSGSTLTFNESPDFEIPSDSDQDNHYEFTIQVSDGENVIDSDVTVTVTDLNEAPVFGTVTEYTVEENSTNPITISASDADGNASLDYSIVGGADQAFFTVSGNALTFSDTPDFEVPSDSDGDNVYTFTLQVSDGTNEIQADFSVTVTDVNEAPAFINTELVITENSTGPLSVIADDPDVGAELTYTITGGIDQDLVTISGSEISLVSTPDFETPVDSDANNVYEFSVRVSDGTNVVDAAFTVTVTDQNESPEFAANTEYTLAENSTEAINITATDVDVNTTLTYSIIGGDDQDDFTLNGSALSFVNAPNFEAPEDADSDNTYEVTLLVSDGTNEVEQAITITVTGVNEAPTSISIDSGVVDEDAAIGTVVGTLSSTDPDASFTHTYSLAATETNFVISDGQLLTNTLFDFDQVFSYNVLVTATDEGGLTYEETLNILIEEVVVNLPNSSVVIDEISDMPVGSSAFELTATTDPADATIIWSILEGDATIDGGTLTPGSTSGLVVVKAEIQATADYNGSEDTESFSLTDPTLIDPIISISLPEEAGTNETVTVSLTFDANGATTVTENDVELSVESGPGALNGNQLSFTGSGTVVVAASLSGTSETNAVYVTAQMEVFEVHNLSGRALDNESNGFSNGAAFLVAADNFNETLSIVLNSDGTFAFSNVKEGEYYLGIGVPQTETTYLVTYYGDISPVLDPTAIPDKLKLTSDQSGLVINMQSKPAPAVNLVDPTTGGKIEFQAQGSADGQNRIVMGRVEVGDPIPNTQVVLSTAEGGYVADGLTDEEGFITFEGLPTGDYRIGVEIPGVGRVETEIPVEEGEQAEVTGLISEDGTVALEVEEVLNVDFNPTEVLTIYPNPVAEQLNLKIENDYYGPLSIMIYDLNGRTMKAFVHDKNSARLSIQEYLEIPSGTYVIQVSGQELSLQQRFIKR